jgi:hypothetical protein
MMLSGQIMVTNDPKMLGNVLAFMIIQMHNVVCLLYTDVPVVEVAHKMSTDPKNVLPY